MAELSYLATNPYPHLSQLLVMNPWNNEHMAPCQGHNIEESKDMFRGKY